MITDWKKIIAVHTELVRRNNDNLFTFKEYLLDKHYVSWSPLVNYEPNDTAGPWTINTNSIYADNFLKNYEANKFEQCFLAGPMVKIRSKLTPIFYKEIGLNKAADSIKLSPKNSKWSIAPDFFNYIDHIFPLGEPSKMIDELFENANRQVKNGKSLSSIISNELRSLADEDSSFEKLIDFSGCESVEAHWIIFGTKDNFGKYDVNIGRDYLSLQESIKISPRKIGGLSVLEKKRTKKDYKEEKIYEVIDLDESQRKCVQALMSDRPLTVITGPPGTGKSQVVVSALLNAWANKQSVLFVSNNNYAVEVVRKRLEDYKEDMPMFVRTGSPKHNNQQETLNEILDIIADYEPDKNKIKDLERRDKEITKTINIIRENLETGSTKEITEAYKSALNAYKATSTILEKSDNEYQTILNAANSYGLYGNIDDLESAIDATEEFYKLGVEKRKLFDDKRKEAQSFEDSLKAAENMRDHHAKDIGMDLEQINDWNFLEDTKSTEYISIYKEVSQISKDFAEITPPNENQWDKLFDSWESAKDATKAADTITEMIKMLEQKSSYISKVYEQKNNLDNQKKQSLKQCRDLDYEHGAGISSSLYQNWLSKWKNYLNAPKSDFDDKWIIGMFTKKSIALDELSKTESVLFESFPVNKVNSLQPINDAIRRSFSDEVQILCEDANINENLQSMSQELKDVDATMKTINNMASDCKFDEIIGDLGKTRLDSIIEKAKNHKSLCNLGVISIEKNKQWLLQRKQLKQSVEQLLSKDHGSRVIRSWEANSGALCYKILDEIRQEPSEENNNKLLDEIYQGSFDIFLDNWKNIEKINQEINGLIKEIKKINAKIHYDEWILSSKKIASKSIEIKDKDDSFRDLEKILFALNGAKEILESWNKYVKETKPQLLKDHKYERERSIEQLKSAVKLIPKSERETTEKILKTINKSPKEDWPLHELTEAFGNFNSESLTNRLEAQKAQLNRNEFLRIKELWISEITKDETVSDAIESIVQLGKKAIDDHQGGRLSKLFKKAIKVMPIWISTAQSLKSIPMIPGLFDLVIIDEASQCTTTNILPVLFRGKRVGMIGDNHQLPPIYTIQKELDEDQIVQGQGLDIEDYPTNLRHFNMNAFKSAWSSLPRTDKNSFSLKNHYRSDPQIIGFSNAHIYRSALTINNRINQAIQKSVQTGVHMIQVSGACERKSGSRSWFNELEAQEVIKKVKLLYKENPNLEIGIVTPYRAQVSLIEQKLDNAGLLENILCSTVDKFQGDERDIMIFSPTISKGSEPGSIRWVEEPHNRINVAITRARHALYVIGDIKYCKKNCKGILLKFAKYCSNIQTLRGSNSPGELELHKLLILRGYNPDIHPLIKDMEVDFLLKDANGIKLVIEVDGSQHKDQINKDAERDAVLEAAGYKVHRIESRDVMDRPIDVIKSIEKYLN